MATTSDNVNGVPVQTQQSFRGSIKGHEFEKVMETGERAAKELKKSKVEDRSNLVKNSYILRDAIGQVLIFLESVRVLKVLVNYWNLVFALLGKEMAISRDPENQLLLMKVVDSSGQHLCNELDFSQCSNLVKQMFGEVSSVPTNTAHSLLTDAIRDLETKIKVSQAMVDEHATEHQDLSVAMHRDETQQKLLQAATSLNASAPSPMSAAGEESEVTGLSGSELEVDIQGQLTNIAVDIDRIKSYMVENDALGPRAQHPSCYAAKRATQATT